MTDTANRVKKIVAERKKQVMDVVLSVVASVLICAAMMYLPLGDMDISKQPIVSFCALVVVVVDELIIYRAQKYIDVDWIQLQITEDEAHFAKKMQAFNSYDESKEKRLSILLGLCGCLVTGIAFIGKREWLAVCFMGITLFLFQQHKIGRRIEMPPPMLAATLLNTPMKPELVPIIIGTLPPIGPTEYS